MEKAHDNPFKKNEKVILCTILVNMSDRYRPTPDGLPFGTDILEPAAERMPSWRYPSSRRTGNQYSKRSVLAL